MKTLLSAGAAAFLATSLAHAEVPAALATPGELLIATFHAEGAQIYECKSDAAGASTWQFREPIATLTMNGKTIGRHYAGPAWALDDGSLIVGKVIGRADGATAADIPLLKLAATPQRSEGMLAATTTILRLDTKGGVAAGPCETVGALRSVAYSADYAFYRKARFSLAVDNPAAPSAGIERLTGDLR
jgi:hypothetical protein